MAPKAAVPAGKQWPEVMQLNAGVTWNTGFSSRKCWLLIKGNEKKIEWFRQKPPYCPKDFFFFFLKLLFLWIENSQPAWAGKLLFLAKAYADICLYLAPTKSCGKIKSWRQPAVPFPHSDSPHSASGGDGKMSITVQSAGMTAKWY